MNVPAAETVRHSGSNYYDAASGRFLRVEDDALATLRERRSMGRRRPNDCRYRVPATALSPPEPSPGGGGQPRPRHTAALPAFAYV